MNSSTEKVFPKGTFGYDLAFLKTHQMNTVELTDSSSKAALLVSPDLQGRVMSSSANGAEGQSFGWINYKLFESGKLSDQFNAFGGEERLWFGPEGGPFSIYFGKGKEQVFSNWLVPKAIDTMPFEIVEQTGNSISFRKEFTLNNASGTRFELGIERNLKMLSRSDSEKALNLTLGDSISFVAYESENTLINTGPNSWTPETGFLSIWMLCMFNPSEKGLVFIPYRTGDAAELGQIVNDNYFGKVPADRLIVDHGVIYFKTDGKHRSKIGLSPKRSLPWCGSYDPVQKVLTLLWFSKPAEQAKYVNSKWGNQDDPLQGDVVNSYNDGPVEDGSVMGPFYEIESSSPAALLASGEKITHTQRIFHLTGSENELGKITEKLFGISLSAIESAFETEK